MKHKSKNDQVPVVNTEQVQHEEKPNSTELAEDTTVPNTDSDTSTNKCDTIKTTYLRPSPSETSLTRSQSLSFPSKQIKHSPDCKDNPYKL